MGNQAHFLFGSRDSPYTGGPTLSPPQEREFLFAPAQLVPSTHHSHGPTIMGARHQACPPSVTMRGEGREGVIPAALGPRRKMFPDPREAGRTTPPSAPTALVLRVQLPKASKRGTRQQEDSPFLAIRMQFSRVSWRHRWGSQHFGSPGLALPRRKPRTRVLGLVRACLVWTVTKDTHRAGGPGGTRREEACTWGNALRKALGTGKERGRSLKN